MWPRHQLALAGFLALYDFTEEILQENYLLNLFSKQHGPLEVKLVYNAMESF
jgi:hypothetical protein